ncbi:sigma-70 family RNA polymerase sigma factor [Streptomyces pathocidini]|uniref:RNA polymerase sigma factor n=1 Tax=Streptomyces pathocidini TaxID=1650571 RepID=UPI00341123EC
MAEKVAVEASDHSAAGDEAAVIARIRAGEPEAYAHLVRAHTRIAHRTAVLLGAGADAEDVVQVAFLKAYQSLERFREGAAFRPWLLRIVANETKNTVRAAGRLLAAVEQEAALMPAKLPLTDSVDPAAAVLASERRSLLLTALEELGDEHRQVVTYRYLLELDEAETAEALGWPRGTVKSRLSRALRRLELLLGRLGVEGGEGSDGHT